MQAAAGAKGKTLYVGGLAEHIRPDDLYAAFVPFGDIVNVEIPNDPAKRADDVTGITPHRGFGFVEYAVQSDAADAVDNMHLNRLAGRVLKVNLAKPLRGQKQLGTNRAVWESEDWLEAHASGNAADGQQMEVESAA